MTALGLLKKKERKKKEGKKEEDERSAWAVISRTPALSMILVKLKVAISSNAPVQHV